MKYNPVSELFFLIFSIIITSLLITGFTGCATEREVTHLQKETELPVYEADEEVDQLELSVLFKVKENGSIEDVRLLNTSGISEWDNAAVDSMKKWTFKPPPDDSESFWFQRRVVVQMQPSYAMNIGELIARNEEEANLLYSRLRAGINFHRLVREAQDNSSIGKGGRYLRNIQTSEYPIDISRKLVELNVGDYTRPVKLGDEYVIFKRFDDNMPDN